MVKKPYFYKYKSLDNIEFVLDILLRERLYAASYHELNDPMEGVIKVDGTIPRSREQEWKNIIENLRIVCFTKKPSDTLMWSHYADGGTGCLIKFELLENQLYHKVSYLKKPVIGNDKFNESGAIEILKYKGKPWKYEGEYRCILNNEVFLPVKVHSITFGPRARPETVSLLIHVLSLCKPDLKVCRMTEMGVFVGPQLMVRQGRTYFVGLKSDECHECYVRNSDISSFLFRRAMKPNTQSISATMLGYNSIFNINDLPKKNE